MSETSPGLEPPWWMKAWFTPWPATGGELVQPILPGWTIGGLVVNEQNSSAPDTERQIVAADSYGRQIGQLLDAVAALIEGQGGAKDVGAYQKLLALKVKVDRTKVSAAARRLDLIRHDLALLKTSDPLAFEAEVEGLGALLLPTLKL
ncbi:hypothetical protein [Phenylobacterium sp.]|uniref:hypothetical protein n=1 Tax=Phenylobacterium sp. TaxID=1871053 RepID=UPI002F412226